jgi:hypothetical protein
MISLARKCPTLGSPIVRRSYAQMGLPAGINPPQVSTLATYPDKHATLDASISKSDKTFVAPKGEFQCCFSLLFVLQAPDCIRSCVVPSAPHAEPFEVIS